MRLDDATPEELAAFALKKDVAHLCDELHDAIEDGLDADTLHDIVSLWEANRSDMTFDSLVAWGRPTACADCGTDVTPYDEDGRPIEGSWQWYIVSEDVWATALAAGGEARYLCVDCLEARIGRSLAPEDFPPIGINEPSWTTTPRLKALFAAG